jgi:PAS domain S-box-containing protein
LLHTTLSPDAQLGRPGLLPVLAWVLLCPITVRAAGDTQQVGPTGWGWVGLAVLVTGLTVGWLSRRKAGKAEGKAAQSLEQVKSLIGHADCILWEAQVELIGADWKWDMKFHPTGLSQRFFGDHSPAEQLDLWCNSQQDRTVIDRRAREALDQMRSGYEQEFRLDREGRIYWLHENVSITPLRPGVFWLVGLVTDITAQREAEEAKRHSEIRLTHLLERTDSLIWQSQLTRKANGEMEWQMFIPPSPLYRRIFNKDPEPPIWFYWHEIGVPEEKEMHQRCTTALDEGASGYQQIFHVPKPEGDIWLSEQVSIKPNGSGQWELVGIITDITARREVEAARQASEEQLRQLMGHANCMLWQANVTRDAGGEYRWEWFVPKSELYRRIVGEDPNVNPIMPWGRLNVPEFDQIEAYSRQAMTQHLPGYEQDFRVILGTEVLWMHEQVSVTHLDENHWKLAGVCIDISANRRAAEARRAADAQLVRMLDVVNCMIWDAEVTVTPQGTLTWAHFMPSSVLYRKIFGDTAETRLLWHTKNVPELEEMNTRAVEAIKYHASGYVNEFHVLLPEGVIWLREEVTIKSLPSGEFRLVGVVTDISARRAAEEAVRNSEQRYRSLFQHTPVAIIEADFTRVGQWLDELRQSGVQDLKNWLAADETRVQHGAGLVQMSNINETALTLFGAKTPLAFRRRRHLLETPDSLRVICAAFVAIWEGRTSLEAGLKMHDLQGGNRHLNLRWWIGRNEAGIDLAQTVMVYIDLTDLKKTEAELASEKERLAVTLRAMTEGVITTDVAGRVLFINPAAATLIQWEVELAIGRLVSEVCAFGNARDGTAVEVPVSRVAQGDVVITLPPQTRLTTRNGLQRLVEGCCAPIHSATSAVIGAVLVFRDVTETERLEEELVRATRLESVGVLAGGIAHDFNNILTAVMGNIALGLLDVPADSPTGVSLRAAEKAAARACDLTQQLLTFAKGGEPVRAAVQLDSIVREMTTFALHGSPVKATYEFAPNLWPADADKGQIGRVVQNLAINSVQAMPAGGTLRVKAVNDRVRGLVRPGLAPGDYILITITDTGEGIPPENLTRIFDPYFTTKKTGSGLGLAAVYSIIKKHRGHIEVESQVGLGTTFRIWLPALHEKAELAVTRPPLIPSAAMNGRVLFMDDDDIIRAMATKLLRRFGLDVVCAADGSEMVEQYRLANAEGRPFAIVVMDLTVPGGMGGLQALAKLKELNPNVKAIVSSGYSSDPVLSNFREHGFCAVVSKPYDIHEFSRVLREALASP